MRSVWRVALILLAVAFVIAPAQAAQKIERTAYIIGPEGDHPDWILAVLKARMERLDRHPTVSRVGNKFRVEVDAKGANGYDLDVLTARALPRIYDNVQVVNQCPRNSTRACIGTPEHPEIGGLLSVFKIAPMGGEIFESVEMGQKDGLGVITVRFRPKAAKKFADLTAKNIGKRLALVVDDILLTAPVVREPITGGVAIITGDFDYMEIWAAMLSQRPLPYALEFIKQTDADPIIRNKRTRK